MRYRNFTIKRNGNQFDVYFGKELWADGFACIGDAEYYVDELYREIHEEMM